MEQHQGTSRYFSGRTYRILSGLFGLFLAGVGVYAVFYGVIHPLLRAGIGLLIATVGAETVWSAIQGRQSWLARSGPLI